MSASPSVPEKPIKTPYVGSRFGRRQLTALFILFVFVMLAVFVFRSIQPRDVVQADHADTGNTALVARGRQLYAIHCASCHGAEMEGQVGWQNRPLELSAPAPPLNATGPTPQRSDQELFRTIQQGSLEPQAMPAFPNLPGSDIWALVSAIKATWPR